MQEFAISDDTGTTKTGPHLYEDIRRTWNEMPHAYISLVKDERRLLLTTLPHWEQSPNRGTIRY
jgi:hypothetical protein